MDQKEFNFIRDRLADKIISIDNYVWIPYYQEADIESFIIMNKRTGLDSLVDDGMKRIVNTLFSKIYSSSKKIKRVDKILSEVFDIKDRDLFNRFLKRFPEIQTGGPILERFATLYRLSDKCREFYFNLASISDRENGVYVLVSKKTPTYYLEEYKYLDGKKIRKEMRLTRTEYKRMVGTSTVYLVDKRTEFYKTLVKKNFVL